MVATYFAKLPWTKANMLQRVALFWERLIQLRLFACRNQRIVMHDALNRDAKPRPFRNRTILR